MKSALLLLLSTASAAYVPPVRRAARLPPLAAAHAIDESDYAADEAAFSVWLSTRFAEEPGADEYSELFADAHDAVLRWRRRYRGKQRIWKALKAERIIKEIVEAAPVLAAACELVANTPHGEPFTIVDLCSGKGFLSMVLSELLPSDRVARCVLVDKAWPPFDHEGPIAPHHISDEHIYGAREGNELRLRASPAAGPWPIPLFTSKQNLKNKATLRGMTRNVFDRCEGPVLLLGVHLCGTLALRACDLFNNNEQVKLLALKPCCLPSMVHANRDEVFSVGDHSFEAREVCAAGRFRAGGVWDGPPRADLGPRFERWTEHLLHGVSVAATSGSKAITFSRVQTKGGYQNLFVWTERGPNVTEPLWERLGRSSYSTSSRNVP